MSPVRHVALQPVFERQLERQLKRQRSEGGGKHKRTVADSTGLPSLIRSAQHIAGDELRQQIEPDTEEVGSNEVQDQEEGLADNGGSAFSAVVLPASPYPESSAAGKTRSLPEEAITKENDGLVESEAPTLDESVEVVSMGQVGCCRWSEEGRGGMSGVTVGCAISGEVCCSSEEAITTNAGTDAMIVDIVESGKTVESPSQCSLRRIDSTRGDEDARSKPYMSHITPSSSASISSSRPSSLSLSSDEDESSILSVRSTCTGLNSVAGSTMREPCPIEKSSTAVSTPPPLSGREKFDDDQYGGTSSRSAPRRSRSRCASLTGRSRVCILLTMVIFVGLMAVIGVLIALGRERRSSGGSDAASTAGSADSMAFLSPAPTLSPSFTGSSQHPYTTDLPKPQTVSREDTSPPSSSAKPASVEDDCIFDEDCREEGLCCGPAGQCMSGPYLCSDDPPPAPSSRPTLAPSDGSGSSFYPTAEQAVRPTASHKTSDTSLSTMVPAASHASSDSRNPNESPSISPTYNPTIGPSTSVPTAVPTTRDPTPAPTLNPPSTSDKSPSSPAESSLVVTFYILAGYFGPQENIESKLASLNRSEEDGGGEFVVHLGGVLPPSEAECSESAYERARAQYSQSPLPIYMVPNDDDWSRCKDPYLSLQRWNDHLGPTLDEAHPTWSAERSDGRRYDVLRQDGRSENFAFLHRRVLFVGANVAEGPPDQSFDAWQARMASNINWVKSNTERNVGDFDVMVLFGSTGFGIDGPVSYFWEDLKASLRLWPWKTLYVEPDVTSTWNVEEDADGISNFVRLQVEVTVWPPLRIAVDGTRSMIHWP